MLFAFHDKVFPLREILRNPKEKAVRVVFGTPDPDTFVVVKFFDAEQQEAATVKWFVGSYEKTRAHWRTTEPVPAAEAGPLIINARRVVDRAVSSLTQPGTAHAATSARPGRAKLNQT